MRWGRVVVRLGRELVAAGVDYFGPVGRKHKRSLEGFSKADVADTTNVVWADLDPPAMTTATDKHVLVGDAEKRLAECERGRIAPSVFVFSGRGCWGYWKLDRPVTQLEAERLMRRLFAQLRREGTEWDIGRIARMPGSVNEKTGLKSFVIADPGPQGSAPPRRRSRVPTAPRRRRSSAIKVA